MARWVHHNAATLLLLQVRARNPTLFRCFIFVWHMIQQTQCTVSGTQTASSACRDRAHRPRLHRVRDSRLSRIPETSSAHLKAFATKRAVSPHSPSFGVFYNDTAECYCFLRLLAAVVRLHRTGTRACSRCVAVYLRILSRRILHRYFLVFFLVFIFPKQAESILELHETNIQAATA